MADNSIEIPPESFWVRYEDISSKLMLPFLCVSGVLLVILIFVMSTLRIILFTCELDVLYLLYTLNIIDMTAYNNNVSQLVRLHFMLEDLACFSVDTIFVCCIIVNILIILPLFMYSLWLLFSIKMIKIV